MATSTTGRSNKGFTLIELLVVLAIIATTTGLISSYVIVDEDWRAESEARLTALVTDCSERARAAQTPHLIRVETGPPRITKGALGTSGEILLDKTQTHLPDDVVINSVSINGKELLSSRADAFIFPDGWMDEVELNLSKDGEELTLHLSRVAGLTHAKAS